MSQFVQPLASRFHAYRSAPFNLLAAGTNIQFNAKDFDVLNEYNNVVNYRFTPIRVGTYRIKASVGFVGVVVGNGLHTLRIRDSSGADIVTSTYYEAPNGSDQTFNCSRIFRSTPNNWYYVTYMNATGAPRVGVANTTATFFEAYRVA